MADTTRRQRPRRHFDDDFKAQAVRLALDEGKRCPYSRAVRPTGHAGWKSGAGTIHPSSTLSLGPPWLVSQVYRGGEVPTWWLYSLTRGSRSCSIRPTPTSGTDPRSSDR